MKIVVKVLVLMFLLAWSPNAYAYDMEFQTYGGFDSVYTAFNIISLIFGNNEYQWMFAGAAALGLFSALISSVYNLLAGQRTSPMTFLMMWLLGVTIYLGFIVPKGNVVLYDPVKNRSATIGGIPDGAVWVAGMLNLVERVVVDIINTTSPPVGFSENAGGVGFDVLLGVDSGVALSDLNLQASVERYITDCVFFELLRPNSGIPAYSIMNNTDFMTLFSQAQNPAIYSLWYTATTPAGETKTCTEAYALVNAAIVASTTYDSSMKTRCAEAGFDPTVSEEFTRCQTAMVAPLNWFSGAAYSATQVFRQAHLAQTFETALRKADPDTMTALATARSAGNAGLASGAAAGTYIPIIKAVMTAVAICMVPVMALLVPTPLFRTAISFTVGLFLLVTLWGVIDAILHSFAINYAKKAFYDVSSNGLGLQAVMNFGTASMKSLAIVAGVRWTGLMIAMAISQTLIKSGGSYAMAQLSGAMTGNVQNAAKQAGGRVTPEGQARGIGEMETAPSVMANAHKFDFQQRADAHTMTRMAGTGAGVGARDHLGGGNVEAGADRIAASNVASQVQGVNRAEGLGGAGYAAQSGQQQGQAERGHMFQDARLAQAIGGLSHVERGEFERNGLITDKIAPAAGKALGLTPAQSKDLIGARADFSVNQQTGQLMMTGARKQTADGSIEYANGVKTVSRTMTAPQILDKADQLEKMGHVATAQGMRNMVSPDAVSSSGTHGTAKAGRGILAHESAKLQEVRSFDDKLATVGVQHGSRSEWFDTASDRQGATVKKGNEVHIGNNTTVGNNEQHGDSYTLKDGSFYQGAGQMAMDGESALVSQISKPGLTAAQRDTERLQVAGSVANDMQTLIKRGGQSQDVSSVDGSKGLKILGTGASLSKGYKTADSYDVNLGAQRYNEVMKQAEKEALAKPGATRENTDKYVAQRLQGAVKEDIAYFEKHGAWHYGAAGVEARAIDAMKPSEKGPDVKRGGVDGIKG